MDGVIPADDRLLHTLAVHLTDVGDEKAAELLSSLIEQLETGAIGALMQKLPPARALDYVPHRIDLLVSSPRIDVRLISAEKEPFTVDWIEDSIAPGDVFFDIGANVGAYSLIAAKATSNGARVFAFEPSPASYLDLVRNVALNDCSGSIVAMPLALWSSTGLLTLDFSSALAGAAQHRVGRYGSTPLGNAIVGVRLDDLVEGFGLPVPTHAKIDTDGYEVEVLLGAERTLVRKEWRSIIIELDRGETPRKRQIQTILGDAGFGVRREHVRRPSPGFPNPDDRPDVYWTFSREASSRRRARDRVVGRKPTSPVQAARRRAVTATLAVVSLLFLLLVLLPEELGDRPYDVFGLRF